MAGFKLINEARDFILHLNKKSDSGPVGHVFAPVSQSLILSARRYDIVNFFFYCFSVPTIWNVLDC